MRETHLILRSELDGWVLALIAVTLVVLAIWAYRRTTRPVPPRTKALLIALRLVAFAALFICLLRPAAETTTYSTEKRSLIVLVDRSRSMSEIEDTEDGVSRLIAAERVRLNEVKGIKALEAGYDLRNLSFARELLLSETSDDFSANYSAYGRALAGALGQVSSGQPEAIVLIGDGSHNLGPPDPLDVAAELAARGIPLYTIGVGREEAGSRLRDVKVVSLDVPRSVYARNTFPVRGRILLRGCKGLTVRVGLELPGPKMQFMAVRVSHDEELVPVEFEGQADEAGELKLTLRAEEVPGELLVDNNARSAFVKVRGEALRVGYFDSLRPESKFVARALAGAEQLTLNRIIVAGRRKLPEPDTDWDRYDVVILGDVSSFCFTGGDLDSLRESVVGAGKGLILLAGKESAGSAGFRGTVLQDVLPVQLPAQWRYAAGERAWQVEADYAAHWITAIGEDASASLRRWEQMPPLSGVIAGAEPKLGAQVLARDQEGLPLLAIQRVGAGRAACVLTDTTFRWFFNEGESQDEHRRFWRQLVLWAGGIEQVHGEKFWITVNRSRAGVGEPLEIQAHLLDGEGQSVRDANVVLEIETPDGEQASAQMTFSRERALFHAEYVPKVAGEYAVRAEATRAGESVGKDSVFFQAVSAERELEEPMADLGLLRRLSAATAEAGGRYYFYSDAAGLVEELAARGKLLRLATSQWRDMWDRPVLFVLFLLALGAEWLVRKRKRLV